MNIMEDPSLPDSRASTEWLAATILDEALREFEEVVKSVKNCANGQGWMQHALLVLVRDVNPVETDAGEAYEPSEFDMVELYEFSNDDENGEDGPGRMTAKDGSTGSGPRLSTLVSLNQMTTTTTTSNRPPNRHTYC
eukprot:SAG22_NODE_363_length_11694_cov_40.815783_15_plen_137_part_00